MLKNRWQASEHINRNIGYLPGSAKNGLYLQDVSTSQPFTAKEFHSKS